MEVCAVCSKISVRWFQKCLQQYLSTKISFLHYSSSILSGLIKKIKINIHNFQNVRFLPIRLTAVFIQTPVPEGLARYTFQKAGSSLEADHFRLTDCRSFYLISIIYSKIIMMITLFPTKMYILSLTRILTSDLNFRWSTKNSSLHPLYPNRTGN